MNTLKQSDFTILVVDDNPTNIMLVKAMLKKSGYVINTADGGKEALDKIEINKPDLILLDVMMPGISGFDLAKILKNDDSTKDISIIFITALDDATDVEIGFMVGGDDYITKPIRPEELSSRILNQIKKIHALRIIERQHSELQKTIDSRDRMYSIIAHDLRSPMGTIKMINNMLVESIDKSSIDDALYEMLESANQISEDTFVLLDNLLKWTKSQLNRLSISFTEASLVPLVKDVVQLYQKIAESKNVKIELGVLSDVDLCIDIELIKTVIRNLLSNAIKFSKENGIIQVSILDSGDTVIVNIKDNGVGINDENKGEVLVSDGFTTYGTKNEEGSGLGLSLCKDFIEKHNGKLWFESVYGEGTTFSFSIPKNKN